MNERDGHEMLVARCKALAEIAREYILLHALDTGTNTPTQLEVHYQLEQMVEKKAPGCGHLIRRGRSSSTSPY